MYDRKKEIYICDICEKEQAPIGPELTIITHNKLGLMKFVFDKDICLTCFSKEEKYAFGDTMKEICHAVLHCPGRSGSARYDYIQCGLRSASNHIKEILDLTERIIDNGKPDA